MLTSCLATGKYRMFSLFQSYTLPGHSNTHYTGHMNDCLITSKTWSYSMTKYIFVAKKLRCWVYTWPLETSQRWQEPCLGISSWSSPPRLSSSQTGAPPCTKTQKSAIASWKSSQNTEALGTLSTASWAHMIKLESQECPYLPLHGAEVAWLLVEVFVE